MESKSKSNHNASGVDACDDVDNSKRSGLLNSVDGKLKFNIDDFAQISLFFGVLMPKYSSKTLTLSLPIW